MNMNKRFIELIEAKFKDKLQEKTGWGRNQVLLKHKEAVAEAALEMLSQEGLG